MAELNMDLVSALIGQWSTTQESLALSVTRMLMTSWSDIDPYDGAAVLRFASAAASISMAGQQQAAAGTEAYLRGVLQVMGVQLPRGRLALTNEPSRKGIDLVTVYSRPAELLRYLVSQKVPKDDAARRAERRLRTLAETDLALAARNAEPAVMAGTDDVVGYRRVIRPEKAKKGSCGLCIVAADRFYHKSRLKPIHDGCNCATLPITATEDPGHYLNGQDLRAIYKAAGNSTYGKDLRRLRVQVNEHGELGPVLSNERHATRGPDDIPS